MQTLLLTLALLTLAFLGIAVRLIFLKDGEFRGTCSTQNKLANPDGGGSCTVCGAAPEEQCKGEPASA
ncbi:MAG: hypothetical protein ACJATA_001806 [Sphingobacteriales bacterium]|jgi:hypothetical protein